MFVHCVFSMLLFSIDVQSPTLLAVSYRRDHLLARGNELGCCIYTVYIHMLKFLA